MLIDILNFPAIPRIDIFSWRWIYPKNLLTILKSTGSLPQSLPSFLPVFECFFKFFFIHDTQIFILISESSKRSIWILIEIAPHFWGFISRCSRGTVFSVYRQYMFNVISNFLSKNIRSRFNIKTTPTSCIVQKFLLLDWLRNFTNGFSYFMY